MSDERRIDRSSWLGALGCAVAFGLLGMSRFALPGTDGYLARFHDDFFYYLKVAENIVEYGKPTFNGIIETNGFHPLWLVVLTILTALAGSSIIVFILVIAILILGAFSTFLLSSRLAFHFSRSEGLSLASATITTMMYYGIADGGMEPIIAVPIFLGFCSFAITRMDLSKAGSALTAGLFMALVVLARIDSVLFYLLFWPGLLLLAPGSGVRSVKTVALIGVGALPLWAYLASNEAFFGVLLPISGLAKQLKPLAWPAHGASFLIPTAGFGFVVICSLTAAAALIRLSFFSGSANDPKARALALAIALFPGLFYAAQSLVSDWPLWPWYLYPWVVAFPVVAAVTLSDSTDRVGRWLASSKWLPILGVCALLLLVSASEFRSADPTRSARGITYLFAKRLQGFAADHPGRYAMGDRAGIVGFLLPDPVLQMEGLVGDKHFIDQIRDQRSLLDILAEYHIDYYVARDAVEDHGCYHVAEPIKSGPLSPRARGIICEEPVLVFQQPGDGEHVVQTVFDLRGLRS